MTVSVNQTQALIRTLSAQWCLDRLRKEQAPKRLFLEAALPLPSGDEAGLLLATAWRKLSEQQWQIN